MHVVYVNVCNVLFNDCKVSLSTVTFAVIFTVLLTVVFTLVFAVLYIDVYSVYCTVL